MTFIKPDREAERQPQVQAIYERQRQAFGYLPNYAELFCHRPEVIDLWADLQRGLRQHVSPRLFELVTFAAAVALESSYCSLAHGLKLRAFFTDVEITLLARGDYDGIVLPGEAAAMRFGAQLAWSASTVVDDEHVAPLRAAGFSDAEIFDIAGVAAGRAFFSKLVEGLGALPDAAYGELPVPFREALSVGRAIASEQAPGPVDGA
ncbi:MAG: peroxidase [Pseudomonadota bacterium]